MYIDRLEADGKLSKLLNILIAIIIFSVIVVFHELGHFLLAKKNGIEVTEFSLGMGPRLLSTVKGNTRYSLKLFPIGGSCMMVGEDGEEDESVVIPFMISVFVFMNVDSERQLRQVYAAVVKRVLKDCASEDVHLPESLIRELETRWIERYASKSNTRLNMEECDCVQEPSTQEVFTPPVSLHCTAHA